MKTATEQLGLGLPEPEPPPRTTFIPRGYDTGHCKFCKARVIWTTMVDQLGEVKINPKTSQPIRNPINVATDPAGKYELTGAGRCRSIVRGDDVAAIDRRTSHWATCPERKAAAAARDAKNARRR